MFKGKHGGTVKCAFSGFLAFWGIPGILSAIIDPDMPPKNMGYYLIHQSKLLLWGALLSIYKVSLVREIDKVYNLELVFLSGVCVIFVGSDRDKLKAVRSPLYKHQ